MSGKLFTDVLNDGTLANLTDEMLKCENINKNKSKIKIGFTALKILSAAAVIVLVIGFLNNTLPMLMNNNAGVEPDDAEIIEDDIYTFIENIKNGVQTFVPQRITKSSFEDYLLSAITDPKDLQRIKSYYILRDASDPNLTARQRKTLLITYPICKTTPIYVLDINASEREINMILEIWNKYSQLIVTKMEENDMYNANGGE